MQGDLVAVDIEGERASWTQKPINSVENEIEVPYIHAFAYRDGNKHSLVLFNLHLKDTMPVNIDIGGFKGQIALHQIAPGSLHDDNEDSDNVTIRNDSLLAGQHVSLNVPAHSLTALSWGEK